MRTFFKFTIGLPFILFGTLLMGTIMCFSWIFGADDIYETLNSDIRGMWKPVGRKRATIF